MTTTLVKKEQNDHATRNILVGTGGRLGLATGLSLGIAGAGQRSQQAVDAVNDARPQGFSTGQLEDFNRRLARAAGKHTLKRALQGTAIGAGVGYGAYRLGKYLGDRKKSKNSLAKRAAMLEFRKDPFSDAWRPENHQDRMKDLSDEFRKTMRNLDRGRMPSAPKPKLDHDKAFEAAKKIVEPSTSTAHKATAIMAYPKWEPLPLTTKQKLKKHALPLALGAAGLVGLGYLAHKKFSKKDEKKQKTAEAPMPSLAKQSILPTTKTASSFSTAVQKNIPQKNDSVSGKEKTASTNEMYEKVASHGVRSILSEVAAGIYLDPILSRMVDAGEIKKVAELARGRFADDVTLDKLASLRQDEFSILATEGLNRRSAGQNTHYPFSLGEKA